jgi:hypothetical protein
VLLSVIVQNNYLLYGEWIRNYQQSAGQSYRGPAVITTPYQQRQPSRNPPSPDPPTGLSTGRLKGFKKVEFSNLP